MTHPAESVPAESVRLKLQFHSKGPISDHPKTLNAYTMWVKSRKALIDAFPQAHTTEFAQKLKLYGTQRYWLLTWLERFQQARTVGESDKETNHAWAALALHYLDQLWPQLDNPDENVLESLEAIHHLVNKIKGHKLVGVAISAECVAPRRIEGFIDLYENNSANATIMNWINNTFLARR